MRREIVADIENERVVFFAVSNNSILKLTFVHGKKSW
jgi:hypothetical protein